MSLVLAVVAAATPGIAMADAVKPTAPTWCGSYKADPYDTMYKYLAEYGKGGFTFRFMPTLAKASCDKPSDAARQAEVAQWRQKFDAYYGITEPENRELLEVSLAGTLDASVTTVCNRVGEDAQRAGGIERARMAAARLALGCGATDSTLLWWIDDVGEMGPLLKAAWVHQSLRMQNLENQPDLDDKGYVIGYALGGRDARSLERGNLEAELKAVGVTGPARLVALQFFGDVKQQADRLTAHFEARAKAEPGIKKALFEIPDRAADEWMKDANTYKAALTDERDVIANAWAGKTSASCSKMNAHLAAYVSAKKPATKEAVIETLTDHIGFRLSMATLLCQVAANDMTAYGLSQVFERAKLRRGPRIHTYYALLELGDTVRGFDPKYLGYLEDKPATTLLAKKPPINFGWVEPKGTIAGLAPGKDGVTVTFKTTRWTEAVWNCVETKKIERIDSNGQLVYHQDCRPTGQTKAMSSTEKPVLIAKEHAANLKVGQFVMFVGNSDKKPVLGGPTFAYSNTDQKKLLSAFGYAL